MGEERSWETAKLSRGAAGRVKPRRWGGMEQTWVCFPFLLAAAHLQLTGTGAWSLPPPGSVTPAERWFILF